ncbi:MAG TPA: hypothetical protein VFN64_08800, partial [Burkholderiaceae bacterium]|nr:hypothetical protein [Burkholderiaceae bacterium]
MRAADLHRRRLLKAAIALASAGLAGCVVAPYGPYYRPSTAHPLATYKGAWCQGMAGPQAVVELPLAPGVALTARTQRNYPERNRPELPLRIEFTLPPNQPARFASATLWVVDARSGSALGQASEITVYRYATLPADAWIDPARVRPSGAAGTASRADAPHGSASLRVSLEPGFTPDLLQLEGLVITREDGAMRMPSVTMSRPASKFSVRDYRSPALHARLEQEAATCRRETPQRACDNIVEHSTVSFAVAEPAAHWSGRWFVFGDGARARVEGGIDFAARAAGRWRMASNAVTVRDANGSARTAEFSQLRLALNDRVALDTPLFAGAVDGTGDARVAIEVLLPDAAPDFDV